jgi:hypothetical protein
MYPITIATMASGTPMKDALLGRVQSLNCFLEGIDFIILYYSNDELTDAYHEAHYQATQIIRQAHAVSVQKVTAGTHSSGAPGYRLFFLSFFNALIAVKSESVKVSRAAI